MDTELKKTKAASKNTSKGESRLSQLLNAYGYTAYKFSKEINISQNVIYKFLKGMHVPKRDTLQAIADYFSIPVNQLIEGTNAAIRNETLLHQLLNEHKCSVTELAKRANVGQNTIYRILRGEGVPRKGTLKSIANYFSISIDELINRMEIPYMVTVDRLLRSNVSRPRRVFQPRGAKINTPLRQLLVEYKCTVDQLAEKTNVARTSIYQILRGRAGCYKQTLQAVADHFAITIDELIDGTEIEIHNPPLHKAKISSPLSSLLSRYECSVSKLAKETNVNVTTIRYLLRCIGSYKQETLKKIADYFSISINELIDGTEIKISVKLK